MLMSWYIANPPEAFGTAPKSFCTPANYIYFDLIVSYLIILTNLEILWSQISPCWPRKQILLNFFLGLSRCCHKAPAKASTPPPPSRYLSTPHRTKICLWCKTYALSNLAEPKTIYSIREDLEASTDTTGIAFCCVYTRKPTCPSSLLGPTLSNMTMISGKAFGVALNMFGLFNLKTNFHDNMVNHVLCVYCMCMFTHHTSSGWF
jgi:hypothetical protein